MSVWISCAGVDAGAVVLGVAWGPFAATHSIAPGKNDAKISRRARFETTERIECMDRAFIVARATATGDSTRKMRRLRQARKGTVPFNLCRSFDSRPGRKVLLFSE
jgi:hypothetical protein